jgi:peptidoglycan/LPS O-acetylase OafA/YrhL
MVGDISLLRATIGYSWLAALFGCLLLLVLSQPQTWLASLMRSKLPSALGAVSYCVYLIHLTILLLAHHLILHTTPEISDFKGIAVTLFAAVMTFVQAAFSWRYFEKPLLRRGHTYAYSEKSFTGSEQQALELSPSQINR